MLFVAGVRPSGSPAAMVAMVPDQLTSNAVAPLTFTWVRSSPFSDAAK
ncbi:MAG TPA: hypothetical protein PLV68_04400 [Ilumatobacteraceae bacterium]|nr:hypothetical protein [Ilumatobacteraceae bacterium]